MSSTVVKSDKTPKPKSGDEKKDKAKPPKKTITKPKKKPETMTIGQILDHAAKMKYDERKQLMAQLAVQQQALCSE